VKTRAKKSCDKKARQIVTRISITRFRTDTTLDLSQKAKLEDWLAGENSGVGLETTYRAKEKRRRSVKEDDEILYTVGEGLGAKRSTPTSAHYYWST
jgi:hypothetical protein